MMSRKIIFASFNKNKVKEVQGMLNMEDIVLLSLADFSDRHIPEAIENGASFRDNALIKARHYYNILNLPVISDDSGLVVPALGNEPGIYSARYAGADATDDKNNQLLLNNLKDYSRNERKAFFQAVVVYKDASTEKIFTGRCDGTIAQQAMGNFGFGYDPLFFVSALNKTYAQLTIQEKSKISHRSMAIKALKAYLNKQSSF